MSNDNGVIKLGCLDQYGESILSERDNGEGSIVEAFQRFLVAAGKGVACQIAKHLGQGKDDDVRATCKLT